MHPNVGRQLLLGLALVSGMYLVIDTFKFNTGDAFIDGLAMFVMFKLRASIPKW